MNRGVKLLPVNLVQSVDHVMDHLQSYIKCSNVAHILLPSVCIPTLSVSILHFYSLLAALAIFF
jgi:hypothetical protein